MTSHNQQRIEELEQQLKTAKRENETLEAENRQLTIGLRQIADVNNYRSAPEIRAQASQVLDTTGALVAMQKRDLLIAHRTLSQLSFPTALRKQWSGEEVQEWIQGTAEVFRQRAMYHGQETSQQGETLQ